MGSFENKNASKLSEGNNVGRNLRSMRKEELGESPKRHNMSQIIEPIAIHKIGSRHALNPISPTNEDPLNMGPNGHMRR